jgi:hypothetical protein
VCDGQLGAVAARLRVLGQAAGDWLGPRARRARLRSSTGSRRQPHTRQRPRHHHPLLAHGIFAAPRTSVEQADPTLVYINKVDKGGHFTAWEEPQLFSEEMRTAIKTIGRS